MAARAVIRQGDKTDHDGIILEGSNGDIVDGRPMASFGHQVYCPKCKGTFNIIQGSSDFILSNGKGVALEGMQTSCGAILLASQRSFVVDWSPDSAPVKTSLTTPYVARASVAPEVSHTVVAVSLLEETDSNRSDICPGMNKAHFCRHMLSLRDDAVVLIQKRLVALEQWSLAEQLRFMTWFGTTDEVARSKIQASLTKMLAVMQQLDCASFVKNTDENVAKVGCEIGSRDPNIAAAACPPDSSHTIFISEHFCELRRYSANMDSQVMTLIHEVSHIKDVMETEDFKYTMRKSRALAQESSSLALKNADNISSYVVS